MSESENNELDIHEPAAFGQQLMLAREKAGLTIEEAARAMNLKQEIVEAIEDSDMDRLPPVTFVQGYIRTYARLLELSEEKILGEFEQEVPHQLESELVPRPPTPDEAASQSPVIKLVSILIIVLAAFVLFYAVYDYYLERTESIEQASQVAADDLNAQLPPEAPLIEDQAEIIPDEEAVPAIAEEPEPIEEQPPAAEPEADTAADPEQETGIMAEDTVAPVDAVVEAEESGASIEDIMPTPTPQPITGGDVLALVAEGECWAEIVDANDIQLFYGTFAQGRELKFTGQAPFEVFLGNAPVVSLSVNSVDIDMTKYIRSNNIAQFKISVENGRARFH